MANLLGWLGKKAKEDILDPINRDVIQPASRFVNNDILKPLNQGYNSPQIQNLIHNPGQELSNAYNHLPAPIRNNPVVGGLNSVIKPTIDFAQPSVEGAIGGIKTTADIPFNYAKALTGLVTGNKKATSNATNKANQEAADLLHFIARAPVRVGLSGADAFHPNGYLSYTPGSTAEKFLFGNQPIDPYAKSLAESQAQGDSTATSQGKLFAAASGDYFALRGGKEAVSKIPGRASQLGDGLSSLRAAKIDEATKLSLFRNILDSHPDAPLQLEGSKAPLGLPGPSGEPLTIETRPSHLIENTGPTSTPGGAVFSDGPVLPTKTQKRVATIEKQLYDFVNGRGKLTPEKAKALQIERYNLVRPVTSSPYVESLSAASEAANTPKLSVNDIPTTTSARTKVSQPKTNTTVETLKADTQPVSPYTTLPKNPNAFTRAWNSVSGVISKYGAGGKEIAKRLDAQRTASEIGQAEFFTKTPTLSKLNKSEMVQFARGLELLDRGKNPKLSDRVVQAIKEWQAVIPEVRNRAVAAGLDVGDLGPNYFPRQYKDLFTNSEKFNKLAQSLVDSGQAKNLAEAIGQLDLMRKEYIKPFGNLERTREFNLPGYEMTHEAIANYINRSYDRITKAEQFGPNGEIVKSQLARMLNSGYDVPTAQKYIKIALGDVEHNTTGAKISSGIRQFNAFTRLGTAGVSNATQSVNTATVTGIGNTAKAIARLVKPSERAFAHETGVLLDHTIANLRDQGLGVQGKVASNVASPGFTVIEKFNRELTAVAGKAYAEKLAKRAANGSKRAEKILREKLGIEGEIGSTLTKQQEIQAARKVTELTQFKVDPQDLPGWVDSPTGKLIAQFRTFGYKQTGFMYNEVIKPALHGNIVPLARFVTLGVPAGVASLSVKGFIKRQDPFSIRGSENQQGASNADKVAQGLGAVGAYGLPGDLQFIINRRSSDRLPQYIASEVGGPTLGTALETATNVAKAFQGDTNYIKRQGLRSVPFAGPGLANELLPYPNSTKKGQSQKADIQELNNGKFKSTSLNRTFSSREAAEKAVFEDQFKKGNDKIKEYGDKVYIKNPRNEQGFTVKTKSDYEFDKIDSKLSLEMDRAKASNDVVAWKTMAQQRIEALQKKKETYDPATDQATIDDLTLKQENLQEQIAKYNSYGGFTKGSGNGKGGKSKRTAINTSGFKTSSRVVKPPAVKKVSARSASFKAPTTRKLSVSKIPSNYLSKKLK